MLALAVSGAFWGMSAAAQAEDMQLSPMFEHSVHLEHTSSGAYSLTVDLDGIPGEFLLDTGASMVTMSRGLFEKVRARGGAVPAGRVAARLASGKLDMMDLFEIPRFTLGGSCELGPITVAVRKRGGRNLLGMSALRQTAPFAVSMTPPALGLSRCGREDIASR